MRVVVAIASYNQSQYLREAINSCYAQNYENLHVVVYDDGSTDDTMKLLDEVSHRYITLAYFGGKTPSGSGEAFNKAIERTRDVSADIVVLLCADDYFTDVNVISDIVKTFKNFPQVDHISRWYYQFEDRKPVRAWRCDDVIELANNPSGLAFRASALKGLKLTNKMFVEAPTLVAEVIKNGFWNILNYDTVAVRIHQSTARSKEYYKKMWVSSPVEEWSKIGGKSLLRDYTSLIQIKNYFSTRAVIKECQNFIRLRPLNAITPTFWFFAIVSVLTPRKILLQIPHLYRKTFGTWFTREVKREA